MRSSRNNGKVGTADMEGSSYAEIQCIIFKKGNLHHCNCVLYHETDLVNCICIAILFKLNNALCKWKQIPEPGLIFSSDTSHLS